MSHHLDLYRYLDCYLIQRST